MNVFQQIIHYFAVYRKYIGYRLCIVFALTTLGAITEGFGIAMLLPLLAATDVGFGGEVIENSGIQLLLQGVLDTLGIGSSMVGIITFIALMFVLKGGIVFLASAYQNHLQASLMRDIKTTMFDRYCTMDYRYYSRRNTGHFVNIINAQITNFVASFENFRRFLTIIIAAGVYLFTAFFLAWNFALMAVVVGVCLLLLFRRLNNYVHRLSRKTAHEQGSLNKFLVQALQGFKYLSSTAQLVHLRTGVVASIRKLALYMRTQAMAHSFTLAISEPIAIAFVMLVIVVQVVVLEAPLAPIFVALVLFNRAMGSILGIQQAWQSTLKRIGSLEIVEKEFAKLENNQEHCGTVTIGPFNKAIEFHDVSFAYSPHTGEVLQHISLAIRARSTVAFVGESGAGKSTLVDLMTLLLRPTDGDLFIDGVSGWDIDLHSWRTQIGYVSQETVVFDDTIANNISLWEGDRIPHEQIMDRIAEAARQAHADTFIRELPDTYYTTVGDRGIRLSGGQRQRLFLARELYKHPRLLILDEATSALDSESERYIQESIDALKGTTTVVLIAHRLSTIRKADVIYVLQKGRIIEYGGYDELISIQDGAFRKMVSLQTL